MNTQEELEALDAEFVSRKLARERRALWIKVAVGVAILPESGGSVGPACADEILAAFDERVKDGMI